MYYMIKLNDEYAYKVEKIEDLKDAFVIFEEKDITNEFGHGNISYISAAVGIHAPAALDIIHSNDMEEAVKLRDSFYRSRIEANSILFTYMHEIKEMSTVIKERFEKLKEELFCHGYEKIEEFCGFELNPDWEKDTIDNAMDEVYEQMPEEVLEKFFKKYNM